MFEDASRCDTALSDAWYVQSSKLQDLTLYAVDLPRTLRTSIQTCISEAELRITLSITKGRSRCCTIEDSHILQLITTALMRWIWFDVTASSRVDGIVLDRTLLQNDGLGQGLVPELKDLAR
mgnify:FL=1